MLDRSSWETARIYDNKKEMLFVESAQRLLSTIVGSIPEIGILSESSSFVKIPAHKLSNLADLVFWCPACHI